MGSCYGYRFGDPNPGLQGELEITTIAGTGRAAARNAAGEVADLVGRVPFLMLALDLPPAPLYKDALEKNIIPQVGTVHGKKPLRKAHLVIGAHLRWMTSGSLRAIHRHTSNVVCEWCMPELWSIPAEAQHHWCLLADPGHRSTCPAAW